MTPLPKYLYCIPFFLSLSAFILLLVRTTCHFVQFTTTTGATVIDPISGEPEPMSLRFGLWYYQSWTVANSTSITEGSCNLYLQTIPIDNNWAAARGFSLTAIIIAGSLLLLDIFQGCLSTKRNKTYRTGAIGYFICCICTGLSLLVLDSNLCKNNALIEELNNQFPSPGGDGTQVQLFEETCSMSQGAKTTIASTVLFFFSSVGIALLHNFHHGEPETNNNHGDVDSDGLDEPLFNDDISNDGMI